MTKKQRRRMSPATRRKMTYEIWANSIPGNRQGAMTGLSGRRYALALIGRKWVHMWPTTEPEANTTKVLVSEWDLMRRAVERAK